MNVVDECRRIVVEILGVENTECANDAELIEDLGADSLDMIEISMHLEEKLGVLLDEQDFDTVKTFGNLVSLVEHKIA